MSWLFAQPLPSFLAVLHVLVALAVTVDVLLKKSDVRGALGWIGIAWFSPILGGILYFLFGINRVTRRAATMSKRRRGPRAAKAQVPTQAPPHIRALLEVGDRLAGEPLTDGNALEILQGGDEAYPPMLEAIAGAKHSIAMMSYIFRNDAAGGAFADALIAARARGVEVRVLMDSIGVGYVFPGIHHRLLRADVKSALFLHTWLPWRMPFLNMRNHSKILVVDGRTAFTGGMNIGAENSAALSGGGAIRDVHFRASGPVVRLAMDAFAKDWHFTTGETLDQDIWWPALRATGAVHAQSLRSGPDADIYKLEMLLGAALNLAEKHVRIVTPYFLPDTRLQFAIAQAVLRGVKVDIVVPEKGNYRIVNWAMHANFRFFRHIAADIHLMQGPFDHTKLCTLDGSWCLIGSSNWDARSLRLNFEFDLQCQDEELTARLDKLIDGKIARARKLDVEALTREPMPLRLRNAMARLMMPYL